MQPTLNPPLQSSVTLFSPCLRNPWKSFITAPMVAGSVDARIQRRSHADRKSGRTRKKLAGSPPAARLEHLPAARSFVAPVLLRNPQRLRGSNVERRSVRQMPAARSVRGIAPPPLKRQRVPGLTDSVLSTAEFLRW
jgi:hypothetical protein